MLVSLTLEWSLHRNRTSSVFFHGCIPPPQHAWGILGARKGLMKVVMPWICHMRNHRLIECIKIEVLLLMNRQRMEIQILWLLLQGSGSQPDCLFYCLTHGSIHIFGVFSESSHEILMDLRGGCFSLFPEINEYMSSEPPISRHVKSPKNEDQKSRVQWSIEMKTSGAELLDVNVPKFKSIHLGLTNCK